MHAADQTIVALSSPPGRGGIGIIRLSGPRALEVALRVFRSRASHRKIEPRVATFGVMTTGGAAQLDEGFLTYHPAGRSFTGDDVVELSCHGSPVLLGEILEALLASGAALAAPGEFTYRAVLNGRIDLPQAEGIRDLINALTPEAVRVAGQQARGALSRRLSALREELIEIISRAEASVEFAEEVEVLAAGGDFPLRIRVLKQMVDSMLSTYRQGRLLRSGAKVVLAGRPNSGKSTLFNRLLSQERALVSPIPGTTRDFLTESIDLNGIPVTLTDTAGLRDAGAGLESQGIARAHERMHEADLIVVLCPVDEEPRPEDRELLEAFAQRALLVASKADLGPQAWQMPGRGILRVSAATGAGVDELRGEIFRFLAQAPALSHEEVIISQARHHEALCACATHLGRACAAVESRVPEEAVLVDLHAALRHLGEITGAFTTADLYDRIFSTFCIGK